MNGLIAWVKGEWATERTAFGRYLIVAGGLVALVLMRQISAMLGRIELGGSSRTMSVLTGPHWGSQALDDAGRLWAQVGGMGRDVEITRAQIAVLIRAHVGVDVVFTALYGVLLWLLLKKVVRRLPDGSMPAWAARAVVLTVVADMAENLLTWVYAGRVERGDPPSAALDAALMALTWAKWGFLLLVLSSALRHWLLRRQDDQHTATLRGATASALRDRIEANPAGVRVWRRHRVQIGTVLVLAVLVALPAGGPLDQLPDVLRTLADGTGIPWGELSSSFLTLALFCLALEVAGRWALLDDMAGDDGTPLLRRPAPRPLTLFVVGLLLAALAVALWRLWTAGGFDFNAGILAAPVVLLALSAAPRLFGLPFRTPGGDAPNCVDLPDAARDRVRRAGRFLAASPVAIAGLGLARAFADPVLAGPLTSTGESWAYLVVGVLAVLVVAPAFYLVLGLLERRLFHESSDASRARTTPVHWLGGIVLAVSAGVAVLAGADPLDVGPILNVTGSVSVLLALVAAGGGLAQRLVERQMPYALTRRLDLGNRSPVFVTAAVVFVVAGLLNTEGGYHAVRLTDDAARPDGWALDAGFGDWLVQAQDCRLTGRYAVAGHDAVPLVLVAAPGGGIRAAYWTDHALAVVEAVGGSDPGATDPCARRRVFAASGVSGGSVGIAVHYAAGEDGDPVSRMSEEGPLAASMAAMLFRDLPAALLGLSSGWADRAAVLEDAWVGVDGALGSTRLVEDLAPGVDDDGGWRPLLLFNGTEVSTGCRVVVSPVPVVATADAGAPSSCRSSALRTTGDGFVHGAVDLLGFRDDRDCAGTAGTDRDVSAATAALLSARFPYVSPSGELFDCAGGDDPVRAADLDGGAAENSGLATTLDLWRALEPLVSAHNASVLAGSSDGSDSTDAPDDGPDSEDAPDVVVVPFLVLVDNHYATSVVPGPVDRQRELSAPVGLLGAKGVLADQGVLEQQALLSFSGTTPGLPEGHPETVRFLRVSPTTRPGVAAPLGWTLSDMTRIELDEQLREAVESACPGRTTADTPLPLSCYLDSLAETPTGPG